MYSIVYIWRGRVGGFALSVSSGMPLIAFLSDPEVGIDSPKRKHALMKYGHVGIRMISGSLLLFGRLASTLSRHVYNAYDMQPG
jgi:hypothetical protein